MSAGDETLERLESLRADAVERARRELAVAARTCARAEASLREARVFEVERTTELSQARRGFAEADSVFTLRCAERRLDALERARQRAGERVVRCLGASERAERERHARKDELRAAELSRRVVSRGLAQRAADVRLRTERREEDERDDQYRAGASARARRDFPST